MTTPLRSTLYHAGRGAYRAVREDVLHGLLGSPKTLPAKLFYDAEGARLFEQICALDEYYLTRSELEILDRYVGEIAELAGPRCALVEYGSGAGIKVRLLLDALVQPAAYVPIDISHEQLSRVARELSVDYPHVAIRPLCTDYTRRLRLPALPSGARRLAFFPGSTIGNFHPAEAAAFLGRVRRAIGTDGALVLGVDRRKDAGVLHAAYNDRNGVTAAFNLNVLARLNRELDADFDLSRFRHVAFFDPATSRIEMHLESAMAQVVRVAGEVVTFERGETIWTESSYKYDMALLDRVAGAAGFDVDRLWSDEGERFWVAFLTPAR